ncbi:MAG: ABC-F family ATP-binding cassette domain-containing protein [Phycisphaerales bacterium]
MLQARGVKKSISFRTLFEGITFSVHPGDRVGIIGPNGAGKSTFLKILAGIETPDSGTVVTDSNPSVAFVSQSDTFDLDATPFHLAQRAASDGADARGEPIDQQEAEVIASIVLSKSGFGNDRETKLAGQYSGGWRKRLSIACALASAGGEPDILILDEPTNHLDLDGLFWLEGLLTRRTARRTSATVFVTHDRDFLDRVANNVAELSAAYPDGLFSVQGNYTEFVRRKREFLDAQAEQQRALSSQVRKDLAWLSRGPQGRGTKAKGRIDESHARIDALSEHKDRSAVLQTTGSKIDFNASGRKTRKLIEAKGISKTLGGKPLFSQLDLILGAGARLGLLGPNGSGKTTLIQVLTGVCPPDSGRVLRSDTPPRVVVFSQYRESFDPQTRLREALCPIGQYVTFREHSMHVTAWARRFLFTDEQLDQPVATLSGGELARIHIARIMLEPSDVLVLDEPTNDLDIPTLEIMEEALEDYPGALVLVTHDRAMLGRLTTEILLLDGFGGSKTFVSLDQALRSFEKSREEKKQSESPKPLKPQVKQQRIKLSYNEQREYDGIEEAIHQAEQRVADAEGTLEDPAVLADHERMAKQCAVLENAQARLAELFTRWEILEQKQADSRA